MEDVDIDAFVQWFQSEGGCLDTKVMGITEFTGSGHGAIALCDIPEGHTLFTLPRTITLSTRTSPLPTLFGHDAWLVHGLHKGWVGLILCMMWEDAWTHETDVMNVRQGQCNPKWGSYMRTLPTTFDTPMFWSAEELEELQGTAVIEKIGRDAAERAYFEQLIPAIKTSPTLFPPSHHGKWYNIDAYHRAGSRILSRSFTVSRWTGDDQAGDKDCIAEGEEGGGEADEAEASHPNTSMDSSMQIDDPHPLRSAPEDTDDRPDSDSDDEEEDDPSDVAMVPMADILNARWGSDNARLFYEPFVLRMVTTKDIKHGEQIFNTYGDPPNSDLLRRYGHVDLIPLPASSLPISHKDGDAEMKDDTDVETIVHLGNPSDVAEIRADLVVQAVQTTNLETKDTRARIEWWLDEGEDDTFILGMPEPGSHWSAILPPALVSFTRLLLMPESDFESARSAGKLPKGNLKKVGAEESKRVLEILDEVFRLREGMYIGGSVEDDERLLAVPEALAERKRLAVIVRLGEKRVLRDVRHVLRVALDELGTTNKNGRGDGKDGTRDKKDGNGNKETRSHKRRAVNKAGGDHGWKKARK